MSEARIHRMEHACPLCGRRFPSGWRLQVHAKSYPAVGEDCRRYLHLFGEPTK